MVLSQATSWCLWWRQKWSVSTTDLLASRPSTLKGCAPEASRSLGDWEAYLGYLEAAPHIPCRVVDSWLQCCIPYSYVVVANEYYRHKHEHDKWSYAFSSFSKTIVIGHLCHVKWNVTSRYNRPNTTTKYGQRSVRLWRTVRGFQASSLRASSLPQKTRSGKNNV